MSAKLPTQGGFFMKTALRLPFLLIFALLLLVASLSNPSTKVTASNSAHDPTWWDKYQFILNSGGDAAPISTSSLALGSNVDVSNECGPQSETFITINPKQLRVLAAGSNEIFRLPMRGYYSANEGTSWGGVDLP